jgi:hypothetical protein
VHCRVSNTSGTGTPSIIDAHLRHIGAVGRLQTLLADLLTLRSRRDELLHHVAELLRRAPPARLDVHLEAAHVGQALDRRRLDCKEERILDLRARGHHSLHDRAGRLGLIAGALVPGLERHPYQAGIGLERERQRIHAGY